MGITNQDRKAVLNEVHNTLGLTKAEVEAIIDKSVQKHVAKRVNQLFPDKISLANHVQALIRDKGSLWWSDSETSFDDYIKSAVVKELLKGVKLKVDIAKNKKEATPTRAVAVRKSGRSLTEMNDG